MNFELPEFNGKAIIFIGKGREAESFEKFIKQYAAPSSYLNVFLKEDDQAALDSIRSIDVTKTVLVKTAGWPGRLVPNAYTTPTKVFFDCVAQLGAEVIGITGTKGKTTTTILLGEILKTTNRDVRICGNMGVPMLDSLQGATKDTLFVVELSSYQLAELEVSPHTAIITNLFNDHTDYHGSIEAYWEAKRNIMRYMTAKDTLIYNPDFEVSEWVKQSPCQTIPITSEQSIDISAAKLIGKHNGLNAAMAVAAAKLQGVSEETCLQVIKEFEPVPHRLQLVAVKNRVTYIDDAIGVNPDATIAGISTIVKEIGPIGCLLLGGQDRNFEYWPLMQLISRLAIPYVVLFPDAGEKIKRLKPNSYNVEFFETTDMQQAVQWASAKCPPDSVCLLSTAAPSYSIWKDFEEKGDLFQQAVKALPEAKDQEKQIS